MEILSDEAKEELIELLSKPSVLDEIANEELFYSSFEGWCSEKSAEEIIAEIRGSRYFRNNDLSF